MRAVAALLALAAAVSAAALDVPYLSGRVNDEAHLLGEEAARDLETKLADFEAKTGHQVAVLTLPSLEGDSLEEFSIKVAKTWKLGRKGKDDGVLLLIAKDDRKMRIEVGYGLEAELPDALCGRIIRSEIAPRFREGDFESGVSAGVDAILGSLSGTYQPPPAASVWSEGAPMSLEEKILACAFVFGVLGIFEVLGLVVPDTGWFLYLFLIPFWAAFPFAILGAKSGLAILGAHLAGFPLAKLFLARSDWGKRNIRVSGSKVFIGGSGFSISSGSSSGGGGFSDSGGFSGGGGDFGGGGASGGW